MCLLDEAARRCGVQRAPDHHDANTGPERRDARQKSKPGAPPCSHRPDSYRSGRAGPRCMLRQGPQPCTVTGQAPSAPAAARTVFAPVSEACDYSVPSHLPFMFNLIVDDRQAVPARAETEGVQPVRDGEHGLRRFRLADGSGRAQGRALATARARLSAATAGMMEVLRWRDTFPDVLAILRC